VTALFGALLAVGQTDIKRILAYSTISQLGYMFLGLATGGVAVGMFHLLTHAFFKALLFLGAGSIIHGCHEEQDIRRMGGLRRWMPVTFATYAVGMMALAGVPLVFSGFWSKDEILHAAWLWNPSRIPCVLGLLGAFLTAFYMTRQVAEVFFGAYRGGANDPEVMRATHHAQAGKANVHESPGVMTGPLVVLAVFAILLGFLGTPAWPWLQSYLEGRVVAFVPEQLGHALPLMLVSTVVVVAGIATGWWLYGNHPRTSVEEPDTLESYFPRVFAAMRNRFGVDGLYDATVVRLHAILSSLSSWMDTLVIGAVVTLTALVTQSLAHLARWIDELLVNPGFDVGCSGMRRGGWGLSRLQGGRAQGYLAGLALGMVVLTVLLVWGRQAG
jgi:NADH-quinone oxidoreductase subunit L